MPPVLHRQSFAVFVELFQCRAGLSVAATTVFEHLSVTMLAVEDETASSLCQVVQA